MSEKDNGAAHNGWHGYSFKTSNKNSWRILESHEIFSEETNKASDPNTLCLVGQCTALNIIITNDHPERRRIYLKPDKPTMEFSLSETLSPQNDFTSVQLNDSKTKNHGLFGSYELEWPTSFCLTILFKFIS